MTATGEDVDSLDTDGDHSEGEFALDNEDFLGSHDGNAQQGRSSSPWTKLKYWWYRKRMGLRSISSAKWHERGIPLYDLDNNGLAIVHGDETVGGPKIAVRIPWRRITLVVLALCVVGISVSLIVNIAVTRPSAGPHRFDPYIKYFNGTHEFYPLTILVSLDGFQPSLVSKTFTPFLYQLYTLSYERNSNVTAAPYMLPSFPSQTFPNHWSIVTGKYPRDHGIVSNVFYDSKLDTEFAPGNLDPQIWSNASEPIWEVLQTAFNYKREKDFPFKVATHMWPGSEVNYSSVPEVPGERMPYYFSKFDSEEKLGEKQDNILKYIDMEDVDQRPQFILTYVPHVDAFGHKHGYPILPEQEYHDQFTNTLSQVDGFVENVVKSIEERNISNFTNVVIVSDHGMSDITFPDHVLIWEDLIKDKFNKKRIQSAYNEGPMLAITTVDRDDINELKRHLQNSLNESELGKMFKIYLNGNFPEDFHYNNLANSRIAPIWIIPEAGYAIMTKENFKHTGKKNHRKTIGSHGYDRRIPEMKSLFLGMGPFFERGYVKPFENVELFDMFLDMFGVSSKDRFGDLDDTFFYQNMLGNDTFSADADYLTTLYGRNNAYNELWGDGITEDVEDETPAENSVEGTGEPPAVEKMATSSSMTQTTMITSSSTSTSSKSHFTSKEQVNSPTITSTQSETPTSAYTTSSTHHNWLGELIDDTKDLLDELIDDLEDFVKGETNDNNNNT